MMAFFRKRPPESVVGAGNERIVRDGLTVIGFPANYHDEGCNDGGGASRPPSQSVDWIRQETAQSVTPRKDNARGAS